ncbi:MAG TPA: hypothetical protein VIL37_03495 [Natronosporangium sp.]
MPDDDPLAPGWRPEYEGEDPSLGDVGSGLLLGVHCFDLYAAGRNELPKAAAAYSDLTVRVNAVDRPLRKTFEVPALGAEPVYDRQAFYQKLSDVERWLRELYCIDTSLEYLAEVSVPMPGFGNANLPAPEPDAALIEVSLGETEPFTRNFWILREPGSLTASGNVPAVLSHLEWLAAGAEGWAFCNVEILRQRVAPVTDLVTDSLDGTVTQLQRVHATLSQRIDDNLGNLGGSIDDWEGDAATNFRTYVYERFPDLLANQQTFVAALAGGLVGVKAIVESAQHSLMNAVHYTAERLRRQLTLRRLESSDDGAGTAFTLLGAGAAVLGALLSGGSLWGVAMESVAAGLAIAATAAESNDGDVYALSGATAQGIFNELESREVRWVAPADVASLPMDRSMWMRTAHYLAGSETPHLG